MSDKPSVIGYLPALLMTLFVVVIGVSPIVLTLVGYGSEVEVAYDWVIDYLFGINIDQESVSHH